MAVSSTNTQQWLLLMLWILSCSAEPTEHEEKDRHPGTSAPGSDTHPDAGNEAGDTASDSDTDPQSDVMDTHPPEPTFRPPTSRQAALAQFSLTCDESLMLRDDCPPGGPVPCMPSEDRILCFLSVRDDTQSLVYNGRAAVRRRGRSSLYYYKPNYSMELRQADGETKNPINFMGMGREEDWVLDGSWMDRSFMRNDLIFDIFTDLGPLHYGPEARYGELTFNGAHHGIYRLVERIKRDDDRIDIEPDDGSGSTFIIKQHQDGTLFDDLRVEYNVWKFIYPNESIVTGTQRMAGQSWLTAFSNALNAGRAMDHLDWNTTVDWVLLQEFAKNVDGFNLSIHLYRDKGGLAVPVPWDFDLAFGQPTFRFDSAYTDYPQPEGWARETNFNRRLKQDAAFLSALAERWIELREGPLSEEWIFTRLDDYQRVLTPDAITRNFAAWPIEEVDFRMIWPNYTIYRVADYADEVARLRQWITARLAWMDAHIHLYSL